MVSHLEKPYGSHEHGGQTHCGHPRLRLMTCPQTRGWCGSQGGKRAGEAQRDAGLCTRGPTAGPQAAGPCAGPGLTQRGSEPLLCAWEDTAR